MYHRPVPPKRKTNIQEKNMKIKKHENTKTRSRRRLKRLRAGDIVILVCQMI